MEYQNDRKAYLETAKNLLLDGELESSQKMYESVLAIDAEQVAALRGLARIATSQNNDEQAVLYWNEVKRVRPDVRECSLRLGRLYQKLKRFTLALGAYEDYLKLEPGHLESQNVLPDLVAMVRHEKSDPAMSRFQHIAIAGVSYCGSTLLARIIGSLPGVENIGESHWLVNKKDTGNGGVVNFDTDSDQELVHCFSCAANCKIITREFRHELQNNPVDWYFKIAERLQCKTIVSADKNYVKLNKLDPALRMDAVVLFKSPMQAWYSNYRKIDVAGISMSPVTDIDKYMQVWADSYHKFLDEFENRDDKLFLFFDSFCDKPSQHLQKLADNLGIAFDQSVLTSASLGQHCFGGNSGVNRNLRNSDNTFAIKSLPVVDLPDEHIKAIESNQHVQSVFQRMMVRYRCDFAIVDPEIGNSIENILQNLSNKQNVVDSKRQAYLKAAEDSERNLRTRTRRLERGSDHYQQVLVGKKLLEQMDWEQYRSLQKMYLQQESVKVHAGFIKYLNLDYWFDAKFRLAKKIGLTEVRGLQVLDIGTGPGHFPLVCRLLGHNVMCTDIDVSNTGSWNKPHLYDALIEFFDLNRRVHRIEPFEKMPALGRRFDLVTGLMIKFNVGPGGVAWGIPEWEFFLDDLADNQLTANGRLFLKMNMTGSDCSVRYVDDNLLVYLESRGALIDLKDSTVDFRKHEMAKAVAA